MYPESAVFNAVSARPLRPPCEEMKYSKTVSPSRKHALTGSSMVLPLGSVMSPRIPDSCLIWFMLPRAPEFAIIQIGLNLSRVPLSFSVTLSVASFQIPTTFL